MSELDAPGRLIVGKYELVSPAGEGGMAVVWKALVRGAGSFQKMVAIKRIQAGKHADPSFIRMFEEEARVGSQLQHPNVVQIMDFGRDEEGGYYLVMEWVEGLDMFQWVRSYHRAMKVTPWPLVAAIGIEVLRGLGAAHERVTETGEPAPIIHRDVSPSNILLGINGTAKLTDFGLARAMDRASMTRPNVIKGKLAYCAPELITGAKASARTDIFGLGVVLWEALAQKRLFTGKNDLEVLLAVRKGEIPPLSSERDDIPAALETVIHQSLAHNPEERFQTAREMARALASVLRSTTEHADAEPLGASVRAARARLGKDPGGTSAGAQIAAAPEPSIDVDLGAPEKSSEDLSMSDVEVVEVELRQKKPVDKPPVQPLESVPEMRHGEPPPKGLWGGGDDESVALPLTRKKD
jgi:serine/threonine-protein kinase